MGDFPMMTPKGTFIINGTERVVVEPARPLAGRVLRPGAGQDLRPRRLQRQGHPEPGCLAGVRRRQARHRRRAHRPQAPPGRSPCCSRPSAGATDRIRERFGWSETAADHAGEGPHRRARTRRCSTSTASCARASRRRARTRRPCSTTSSSTRSGTTWPRSAGTRSTRSSSSTCRSRTGTLTEDDIVATDRVPLPAARRRGGLRGRRHRPLRQPAAAHRRRADPEPGPGRPVPDGAGRPGADDHPGRRGDHAADPDQHPPGGGGDQGVLRHVAAVAVHGPDQPAGGPDPQAPAVRARPGWSVPGAGRLRGPRRAPVATTAGCARSRRRKARTSA